MIEVNDLKRRLDDHLEMYSMEVLQQRSEMQNVKTILKQNSQSIVQITNATKTVIRKMQSDHEKMSKDMINKHNKMMNDIVDQNAKAIDTINSKIKDPVRMWNQVQGFKTTATNIGKLIIFSSAVITAIGVVIAVVKVG